MWRNLSETYVGELFTSLTLQMPLKKKILALNQSEILRKFHLQQQNPQQNFSHKELAEREVPHCNCRVKAECPMPDQCMNSNMVYRYQVTRLDTNSTESYTGCTVGFKERHKAHMKQSVEDTGKTTTLSRHIKSLRSSNVQYNINWTFKERAAPFNTNIGWCRLCTLERYHILFQPEDASLNLRSEFFSPCFHKDRQLLINRKPL